MDDDLPLLACIPKHTAPSINGQFDPLVTGRIPCRYSGSRESSEGSDKRGHQMMPLKNKGSALCLAGNGNAGRMLSPLEVPRPYISCQSTTPSK
jgi:hypothetical protein